MAQNKMLIDASHPEETRVVVVRGNRVEEFDFESQAKRQLRGNIYLAKVTRVEPSLQAAFIDYGGNRHGFLAFSEIHPDYYQIPAADRQALLAEEAAAEEREAEAEEAAGDAEAERAEMEVELDAVEDERERAEIDETDSDDGGFEAADQDEDASEADNDDGDEEEDDGETVMAATIETDSISEPAPDDGEGAGNGDAGEAEATKKPVRKRSPRKKAPARKKAGAEAVSEGAGDDAVETAEEAGVSAVEADAVTPETEAAEIDGEADGEEADAKPAKRGRRGSSRRGKGGSRRGRRGGTDDETSASGEDDEGHLQNGNGEEAVARPVESVGQEDALEEVPVRQKLRRQHKIQEVIRRRQIMLVQVVKEERGTKGAALTTYLSLAGRYSVLMPNTARGGGISRKITNPADRKRLKEIAAELEVPSGMGVILRTAGASRTNAEVKRDFEYLMRLWDNVRNLTLASSAPCLVYEEGSLVKRSIRDLYDKDIGEVLVAGEEGYKEAKEFMRMLMPSHAKNVKLYQGEQPLFSKFGVETQLDKMLAQQVALKSGGYLVINQTEALVAIDVNSGRSTREHSIEATALQTNLEAAEEVARQLRLRDLAGLIVIDFIDMEEKRNNRSVERKLKECLKNDRARIQVGHISHFGLMEMSRQRIRASVLESTMDVCPHCGGAGHVRSASSLGILVLRSIEEHLIRHSRFNVLVRLAPASALYILNHKRDAISDLESRYGVHIHFEVDPSITGQNYFIEKGDQATGTPRPSRAIGMMDAEESDEAEVDDAVAEEAEEETEETGEATDSAEAGGESRNGRRKRKRRRGRGRGRDREASGEGAEALTEGDDEATPDVETEVDMEPAEESVEAQPKAATAPERPQKRRESRQERSEKAREPAKPEAEASETGEEAVSRRPRRQTGRPGKKAASPATTDVAGREPEQAGNGSAESAQAGKTSAPPRPQRSRNTRRVKDGETDTAGSEEAQEPVSTHEQQADTQEPQPEGAEEGKKKGFWSGGFLS